MSDFTQTPNTGRLMPAKEKKHEKAPDFWGSVHLDKDLLIDLVKNRTSELIEIKLDGWKSQSQAGNHYLSLKVNTWKPENKSAPASKDPWEN